MSIRKIHRFTLIEAVISLALLAALSAVMFSMSTQNRDQLRSERTLREGRAIQAAMTPDLNGGISRFLSDMGRYPGIHNTVMTPGPDGTRGYRKGEILAELFDRSLFIQDNKTNTLNRRFLYPTTPDIWFDALGITSASEFTSIRERWMKKNTPFPPVSMRMGWNGPYVEAPGNKLLDGWGNEWVPILFNGNDLTLPLQNKTFTKEAVEYLIEHQEIYGIRSLGANARYDDPAISDPTLPDGAEDQDYRFSRNLCATFSDFQEDQYAALDVTLQCGTNQKTCLILNQDYAASLPGKRMADTVYYVGDRVTQDGAVYQCAAIAGALPGSGKSGTTTTYDFSPQTRTQFRDGNIVWERIYPQPHHLTRPHLLLFYPDFPNRTNGGRIQCIKAVEENGVFRFKSLIPGKRKIYAMGYLLLKDKEGAQHLWNPMQTSQAAEVILKPGPNEITLTLDPLEER